VGNNQQLHSELLEYICEKTREICKTLPEAMEKKDGFGYVTFFVRNKSFVKITDRATICFKSNKQMQALLVEDERFYKTPYLGRHGWVSITCPKESDWGELTERMQEAYLRAAPKALVKQWMDVHRRNQ
jgi:hypothetical protein